MKRRRVEPKRTANTPSNILWCLSLYYCCCCCWTSTTVSAAPPSSSTFNVEVERRVIDRLTDYLNTPSNATELVANYRSYGGFLYNMDGRDRNAYLTLSYSLKPNHVYFGLEDGTFLGHFADRQPVNYVGYREPGRSFYEPNHDEYGKYYGLCLEVEDGQSRNCTMTVGQEYVQCRNDCQLSPCPDSHSQVDCNSLFFNDTALRQDCLDRRIWCPEYEIKTVSVPTERGFVPLVLSCYNSIGQPTQTAGQVVYSDFNQGEYLGDCLFRDGITRVQNNVAGDYFYCQGQGNSCPSDITILSTTDNERIECDTTFTGAHRTIEYDPRYRPWYNQSRVLQVPNWSPPYPFATSLDIGVTYSHPIYNVDQNNRTIFAGVVAVDFTFDNIENFLKTAYGSSDVSVVIYEDKGPQHYVIGSSTSGKAAKKVLVEDETTECDDAANPAVLCRAVRVKMADFDTSETRLVQAFWKQRAEGYPTDRAVIVPGNDGQLYQSQSTLYEHLGANLRWRIIILSPALKDDDAAIVQSDSLFAVVIAIGLIGFLLCILQFVVLYRNRQQRAVINSDWRFTGLFVLGCAVLNLSTLSLLGENTDQMCMLRMWLFHFLLALALAPLFAKTIRLVKLYRHSQSFRRTKVSHKQTAMWYMLPIVLLQLCILLLFTFVDPVRQTEEVHVEHFVVTQRLVCARQTPAFFIVQLCFEMGLILIGCVLSYMTRNIDERLGESKQLLFAMYNIAFIGLITVLFLSLVDSNAHADALVQAVAVLWGTVFSSASFVLPRLLQVHRDVGGGTLTRNTSSVVAHASHGWDPRRLSLSQAPSQVYPSYSSHCVNNDHSDSESQDDVLVIEEVDDNNNMEPRRKLSIVMEVSGEQKESASLELGGSVEF